MSPSKKTRRKKSKASSIQPRNAARTVFFCVLVKVMGPPNRHSPDSRRCRLHVASGVAPWQASLTLDNSDERAPPHANPQAQKAHPIGLDEYFDRGSNRHQNHCRSAQPMSLMGRVSRASSVQTAVRNCTRDEGGPFEAGRQGQASNHCKLLSSKAMVVSVAANVGTNPSGEVERGERKQTADEVSKSD